MILTWMVLSLVVAALLGLTGTLVEWAALAYRRAARWGWIAVLLASAGLGIAGPVSGRFLPRTTSAATAANDPAAGRGSVAPALGARVAATLDAVATAGKGLDGALAATWILSSLACALCLALAHRKLGRERGTWRRADFDGEPVLVSDDLGPAVVGFRLPEIVVPAWALAMDAGSRELIARHEREHLVAGDQRLVLLGVVAVIAAPWNLVLWWQLRRLRLAIEIDCDRRALRSGAGLRAYGNLLLVLGERSARMPAVAAPLAERGSALVRRVRAMTRAAPRWRAMRASVAVTGASLLAGAVAILPGPPPSRAPSPGARQGGVYRATLRARPLEEGVTTPRAPDAATSSPPGRVAGFVRRVPAGTLRARGVAPAATRNGSDATPSRSTLREIRATAVPSPRDTLPPPRPD